MLQHHLISRGGRETRTPTGAAAHATMLTDHLPTRPPACSTIARTLAEPLRGTAAVSQGWLLIQHQGAWQRDGIVTVGADPRAAKVLGERIDAAGIQVCLIRDATLPPVHGGPEPAARTVFLVRSLRPNPWIEQYRIDSLDELLDIDLDQIHYPVPPGVGIQRERLYLVCTHGRKDACCAAYGRPVVRALEHRRGEVWESSHVGGDRFAAAMVCLPEGIYYGHVAPDSAETLISRHIAGHVSLPNLRGRCCDQPPVQIAEHALRCELGVTGIGDIVPVGHHARADGDVDVHLRHHSRLLCVRLRSNPVSRPRLTSCTAGEWTSPDPYEVVDIHDVELEEVA